MKEYEIISDRGIKYTFVIERIPNSDNKKQVRIQRFYTTKPLLSSSKSFPYTRVIEDKKVIWMDVVGVIVDHTPLDVRRYIEKILKNIAFA